MVPLVANKLTLVLISLGTTAISVPKSGSFNDNTFTVVWASSSPNLIFDNGFIAAFDFFAAGMAAIIAIAGGINEG